MERQERERSLAAAEAALRRGHARAALERLEPLVNQGGADLPVLVLMAQALRLLGRAAEAAGFLKRAVELRPDHAGLHTNLSALQRELGDPAAAARSARRALTLTPDLLGGRINLGLALEDLGERGPSLEAFAEAVRQHPESHSARRHLALARYGAGRAQVTARREMAALLAQRPEDHELRATLASAWLQHGDPAASKREYARLLGAEGAGARAEAHRWHSSAILAGLHDPATPPGETAALARDWAGHYGAVKAVRPAAPGVGELRIGWLSPRFTHGPVGSFLLAVLEASRQPGLEHVLYATRPAAGPEADRFRACADRWRDLDPDAPQQAARTIADDRLHVLVDLAGHAPRGLLRALAARPAPVQVTWLDSFVTTGLDAFDAFFTDDYLSPPGSERDHSEPLLRLPGGRLCYRPTREFPAPAAPVRREGPAVLASFNRLSKLNDEVLGTWARILAGLPEATLWLRNARFDDGEVRAEFLGRCKAQGLDPDRLRLDGFCDYASMMRDYENVDLVLDPFPFSGCTTTCDALWMGVPVVTWPGRALASRQSGAVLDRLGLHDCIAGSEQDYVSIATRLARDRKRLDELRARLRRDLILAFDPDRFAGELLATLRKLVT